MAETAALLVEHPLPEVPWRQWVLSFERPMVVRLGYDRPLLVRACPRFAKRVMQTLRQQSKREHGVHFKKPNRFGATFAQMTPDTFLARLCALVPPPRAHTVLYYGVLSAHHALRPAVVPCANESKPEPKQLSLFISHGQLGLSAITTVKLLARVFRLDISVCSRCSGPMRVTRAVTTPEEIAAELRGGRPPPRASPGGQPLLFSAPPATH